MGGALGDNHVRRARLTDVVAANRVTVVEAGAGFGKSALSAEASDGLGLVTVTVRVGPSDGDAELFVVRVKRAFGRAGLSDVASAEGSVDDVLDLLTQLDEPVLIVLDDVHNVEGTDAADVVLELAASLPPPHRLLVLGRNLTGAMQKLRYAHGVALLVTEDLAFRSDELALVLNGHGVDAPGAAEAVMRATGGWPAAVILAARQLTKHGERVDTLSALIDPRESVVELLRMVLDESSAGDRDAATQLAHLPVLTRELVGEIFGDDALWSRLLAAGFPLSPSGDGSFELPGPVRDHLVSLAPLKPTVGRCAADAYTRIGEVRAAIDVLMLVGDGLGAADAIANLAQSSFHPFEFSELLTITEALPPDAIAARPRVLLVLARMATFADRFGHRFVALTRLEELLDATPDQALRDALNLEIASDLFRLLRGDDAIARVEGIAERLGPTQIDERARLLVIQGRYACRCSDFENAVRFLEEAKRLAMQMGDRQRASAVGYNLATEALYYMGRIAEALEVARESRALAVSPMLQLARINLIADLATDLGYYEEAEAAIADQAALATRHHAERWLAYVPWSEARIASQKGNAAATLRAIAAVETHASDQWFEATAPYFHADAADMLARVGESEAAWAHSRAALEGWPGHPHDMIDAIVEARIGDPEVAEAKFAALPGFRDRREDWRILLFRAYAAHRRGDPKAAALAAAAFDRAANDGLADAPMVRERVVAEALVALAVEGGSAAARALVSADLPWTITMLGGFEVRHGGAVVALAPGKPTQAVKVVAAAGGRLTLDEFIDALWPDADIETGRRGVRNVLNRLRSSAELLVRDGNDLVLAPGARVDLALFEAEANAALASDVEDAPRISTARAALARYRGELLPSDRYEPWATVPRERARRRFVALVDLLIDDAAARAEVDEAVRLCERAIEVDPYDEERYVRAGLLLAQHGRVTQARTVVTRATAMLRELDLEPSRELQTLMGV